MVCGGIYLLFRRQKVFTPELGASPVTEASAEMVELGSNFEDRWRILAMAQGQFGAGIVGERLLGKAKDWAAPEIKWLLVVFGVGFLAEQVVEFPVVGTLLLVYALLLALADCYVAGSCEKYVGLKDWLGAVGSRPLLTSPCLALIGWVMGLYYFLKLL